MYAINVKHSPNFKEWLGIQGHTTQEYYKVEFLEIEFGRKFHIVLLARVNNIYMGESI